MVRLTDQTNLNSPPISKNERIQSETAFTEEGQQKQQKSIYIQYTTLCSDIFTVVFTFISWNCWMTKMFQHSTNVSLAWDRIQGKFRLFSKLLQCRYPVASRTDLWCLQGHIIPRKRKPHWQETLLLTLCFE